MICSREQFQKNPLQSFILSLIIFIHIVFLLILIISPSFAFRKKEQKPLIVKTIIPKPPSRTIPLEKKAPVTAPKAITTPPTKQQTPKKEAPASKTMAPKPAPIPKKEAAVVEKRLSKSKQNPPAAKKSPPERAKISDSLLKELEESIATIDKKSVSKMTSPSKAIAPIPLQIDLHSSDSEADADYTDLLVSKLHESLRLPDFGEVKIQLSLRQDGSVVKVVVLKAQSEKNKQYLESNLTRLKFPRFEGTYSNKKEYTFILRFCNE